jgi:multicomponent K+:H+ antiporter subunit F
MSETILLVAVTAAQLMLALAMALALARMIRGPRAQDRVLGLDTLYVNSMLMVLTFGIRTGSTSRQRSSSPRSASSRPRRLPSS